VLKFEENVEVDVDVDGGGFSLPPSTTTENWNLESGESLSSSSVSMASSGGSFVAASSVLEWSSMEESELVFPLGFSLIVCVWRR
jgi:hypothetical protein